VCVMERSNSCSVIMDTQRIANGAEISRIDGFVKIAKKKRTKSTGASVKYQYFCRIVSNEAEVV
jgi:hypothetical protein